MVVRKQLLDERRRRDALLEKGRAERARIRKAMMQNAARTSRFARDGDIGGRTAELARGEYLVQVAMSVEEGHQRQGRVQVVRTDSTRLQAQNEHTHLICCCTQRSANC